MRILSFNQIKWDKKYIIWFAGAFALGIICGIVLFKIANIGCYFTDYAKNYVVCIFAFDYATLIISCLFRELVYLYAFFAISYFTKWKILTVLIQFFRTLICVLYSAVLFGSLGFSGIISALIIYIPCFLVSSCACLLVAETCRIVNKKFVFIYPAAMALAVCVILLVLLNVVFRILIVIV